MKLKRNSTLFVFLCVLGLLLSLEVFYVSFTALGLNINESLHGETGLFNNIDKEEDLSSQENISKFQSENEIPGGLEEVFTPNLNQEEDNEDYNKVKEDEDIDEDIEGNCNFPLAWKSTLSEYARRRGFNVGAYLNVCFSDRQLNPGECREIIKKEYSQMMIPVQDQWKWSESKRGIINSPGLDEMLNFARTNNIKLHFYHLIWSDRYAPRWLFPNPGDADCGGWSKDELLSIMENRINGYIKYTNDVAIAWNVVNEVFKEDGSFANFCWYRVLGEEYIDKAFIFAREASPNGLLVFNDNFGNGRMSRVEIDAVFKYIKSAKSRGIPIDAFGLQNHLYSTDGEQFSEEYLKDLEYFFNKAEDAGVKVLITEMDVYQASYSDYDVRDLYRTVVARCLRRQNCISFSTWGVDDQSSWLRSTHELDARPLLFDFDFKRKPAYYGVTTAIKDNRKEVCIK